MPKLGNNISLEKIFKLWMPLSSLKDIWLLRMSWKHTILWQIHAPCMTSFSLLISSECVTSYSSLPISSMFLTFLLTFITKFMYSCQLLLGSYINNNTLLLILFWFSVPRIWLIIFGVYISNILFLQCRLRKFEYIALVRDMSRKTCLGLKILYTQGKFWLSIILSVILSKVFFSCFQSHI